VKYFNNEIIFTEAFFYTLKDWQLRDADPKNPLYSPFFGDCKNIGNIHIFCASNEFFTFQAIEFCNKLLEEKIWYNLDITKDVFHDFPLAILPKEAVEVNKKIFNIIKNKN
jgi:hypothetical protein